MRKVLSLLLILLTTSYAQVHYCLQLISSPLLKDVEPLYQKLKDIPNARIERINGLYTLRVGVFEEVKSARAYLRLLRSEGKAVKGAFVRRCAMKPERIVEGSIGEPTKDLYRLLITALLGARKLETALRVAERGTQLFPEDPYWWKLYAQLLAWTGKVKESLNPLIKAYELSGDKEVLRRIFDTALSLGRYDIAKKYMDYLELTEKERMLVYTGTGDIEGLIEILKTKEDRESLIKLTELLFAVGDGEGVLKTAKRFENLYGRNEKIDLLRARVLFARREYSEALKILKPYLEGNTSHKEILSMIATIAWMEGEKETSLRATLRLMEIGKAEEIDYDRATLILAKRDPQRAISLSIEAWERFKKERFIRRALEVAYASGMWREVLRIVEDFYGERAEHDEEIFSYKMTALHKLGWTEGVINSLRKRIEVSPSPLLVSSYLYLLIDSHRTEELKKAVRELRPYEKESPRAFVSAYLYLGRGSSAMRLYRKSSMEERLLLSYILDLLGDSERARKLRFEEFKKRDKLVKSAEDLPSDPNFLTDYLLLAHDFLPRPSYRKLLDRAKGRIPPNLLRELELTESLSGDFLERVRFLVRIRGYRLKPWMDISLALRERDALRVLMLEERYGDALPPADRSEGLSLAGREGKAFEVAFSGLEENPKHQGLYLRLREISMRREARTSLGGGYLRRRGYQELSTSLGVSTGRIASLGEVGVSIRSFKPISKEDSVVGNMPEGRLLNLFLRKREDRWGLEFKIGEIRRVRSNVSAGFSLDLRPIKLLRVGVEGGRNAMSEETLYLYLGGLKDYLRARLSGYIGDRFVVSGEYELTNFYSQGRERLGIGRLSTLSLSYQVRYSYPDLRADLYVQRGRFVASSYGGDLGGVVPSTGFEIIPRDYTSVGGSVTFGDEHKTRYTRVWRPFGTLLAGYNSRYGRLLGVSLGAGGSVFDKDNLSLEMSLSENVGATQETIMRLNLLYQRWF